MPARIGLEGSDRLPEALLPARVPGSEPSPAEVHEDFRPFVREG
jgi:hypothetical protein